MNDAGIRAIKRELANVEDNLYRYRHLAKPTDPTGGGPETVADVIRALEAKRDELLEALR